MPKISDEQAKGLGVGASGKGKSWHFYESEGRDMIALYSDKSRSFIYRRALSKPEEEEVPISSEPEAAPPPRPQIASPEPPSSDPEIEASPEARVPPQEITRFSASPPAHEQGMDKMLSLPSSIDESDLSTAMDFAPPSLMQPQAPQMPEMSEIEIPDQDKIDVTQPAPLEPNISVIKKVSRASPVMAKVLTESAKEIGATPSTADSVIVTEKALSESSSNDGTYSLRIDPNTNRAQLLDQAENVIAVFPVGTGDITGTQYGKPYFTPTGTFDIINEVPYAQMEGSYGPLWMGLSEPKYGLHGPHQQSSLTEDDSEFINEGYVSHGCIRFREADILAVGKYLDAGARVEIMPYEDR